MKTSHKFLKDKVTRLHNICLQRIFQIQSFQIILVNVLITAFTDSKLIIFKTEILEVSQFVVDAIA